MEATPQHRAISLTLICPPKETGFAVQRENQGPSGQSQMVLGKLRGARAQQSTCLGGWWDTGSPVSVSKPEMGLLTHCTQDSEVSHGVGSYSLGQG